MKALFYAYILLSFLINALGPVPLAQAQEFHLPAPGVMVHLSPPFDPPILKGIKVHPDNPLRFDFILDKGDSVLSSNQLKDESSKLIKYFLASLTIPEKDLWVNLSPYEKDRIIPASFGLTEMGRDLLAEDYMLKQITASIIYPEGAIGIKFWKRIYEEAEKKYETTNIPVNTFNKVWIVPQKALVYENAKAATAYVVESKLKVMLEQDYLSLEKHEGIQSKQAQAKDTNQLGSQIVREIVIPELTKEVNEDKNFAQLRQVYNSLILATWYKKKIKDSIFAQVYADKNKIAGIRYVSSVIPAKLGIRFKNDVEGLYKEYLKAFKKGVYNYIKEDFDPITQETIPRKYFSGGMAFDKAMTTNLSYTSNSENLEKIPIPKMKLEEVVMYAGRSTSEARSTTLKYAGALGVLSTAMLAGHLMFHHQVQVLGKTWASAARVVNSGLRNAEFFRIREGQVGGRVSTNNIKPGDIEREYHLVQPNTAVIESISNPNGEEKVVKLQGGVNDFPVGEAGTRFDPLVPVTVAWNDYVNNKELKNVYVVDNTGAVTPVSDSREPIKLPSGSEICIVHPASETREMMTGYFSANAVTEGSPKVDSVGLLISELAYRADPLVSSQVILGRLKRHSHLPPVEPLSSNHGDYAPSAPRSVGYEMSVSHLPATVRVTSRNDDNNTGQPIIVSTYEQEIRLQLSNPKENSRVTVEVWAQARGPQAAIYSFNEKKVSEVYASNKTSTFQRVLLGRFTLKPGEKRACSFSVLAGSVFPVAITVMQSASQAKIGAITSEPYPVVSYGEKHAASFSVQKDLAMQAALPTDLETAKAGVEAFETMMASLPPDIESHIYERNVAWRLSMVYCGITASVLFRDEVVFNSTNRNILIRAIERNKNMKVIKHADGPYDVLNLVAAQRIIHANEGILYDGQLIFPSQNVQHLLDDPGEWFELGDDDGIRTVRYGLLSGFPRNATINFAKFQKAYDKITQSPVFDVNDPVLVEVYHGQEEPRTPAKKRDLEMRLSEKFPFLTDEDLDVLASRYGVSYAGLGGFVGFSEEDRAWAKELSEIHRQAMSEISDDIISKTQDYRQEAIMRRIFKERRRLELKQALPSDRAALEKGGIDLTPGNMNLQTQNSGGEIQFHTNLLGHNFTNLFAQLQNAPGFVPVIISIQPMTDIRRFLGVKDQNSPSLT